MLDTDIEDSHCWEWLAEFHNMENQSRIFVNAWTAWTSFYLYYGRWIRFLLTLLTQLKLFMSHMFITAQLSLPALWIFKKTLISFKSLELIVTGHGTENASVLVYLNLILRKQYIVAAWIRCNIKLHSCLDMFLCMNRGIIRFSKAWIKTGLKSEFWG